MFGFALEIFITVKKDIFLLMKINLLHASIMATCSPSSICVVERMHSDAKYFFYFHFFCFSYETISLGFTTQGKYDANGKPEKQTAIETKEPPGQIY